MLIVAHWPQYHVAPNCPTCQCGIFGCHLCWAFKKELSVTNRLAWLAAEAPLVAGLCHGVL